VSRLSVPELTFCCGVAGCAGGIVGLGTPVIIVENAIVMSNIAGDSGGGILVESSTLRVTDTTIANNTAGKYGGKPQPRQEAAPPRALRCLAG
jgi:hypothetical protein